MPYLKPERPEKVTAPSLKASKERGERLVCLTAYDYPTARIVDEAGIDIILVGDSLGNVVLGYGNTVPVTLDEILIHLRAVRRAVQRALLVADMPYGSFHTGADDAVRNALRLVKEGGAEAIKLEGAGAFAIVLEVVPREIATMITESVSIPTIGIGAGAGCDIQVLVLHDMLGLSFGKLARFVRPYANLHEIMTDAVTRYADDVRNGSYPSEDESYALPAEVAEELKIEKPVNRKS